jgi:hypothetical protein
MCQNCDRDRIVVRFTTKHYMVPRHGLLKIGGEIVPSLYFPLDFHLLKMFYAPSGYHVLLDFKGTQPMD